MRLSKRFALVIAFCVALIPALAQTQNDPLGPPSNENEIPVYLPGGSEAGPTLSSQRGIGPIRSGESLVKISPYLGVSGIYDTGLGRFAKDEQGNLLNREAYGVELSFGILGSKVYRRTLLNVAYRGNYRQYTSQVGLNGSSHRGEVQVNHAFSRRMQLNSSNTFGYFNNSFFSNFGFAGRNDYESGLPVNDFFNVPVLFAQSTQILTYQKTARLSFSGGGGGSLQWRDAEALAGMKAVNAIGSASYRISARQTLAANYQFSQFFFSNQYGGSNVHTVSAEYGAKLSRTTTITLLFGGSRVESQSLRIVQLDPLLAELLGRPSGIEAEYRKNYLPTFGASLSHNKRAWSFGLTARRGVTPGNGLVLTNQTTGYSATANYAGGRRWNVGGGVSYTSMSSLKANTGDYEGYGANIGYNLQLARGFSWTVGTSWRRFGAASSALSENLLDRDQYRVQTGIYWSPSAVPLPFF